MDRQKCDLLGEMLPSIIHLIRAALHESGYSTILANPNQANPGLRADLLFFWIAGHPDTSMDVAISCPAAPTFLEGSQVRCGKAAHTKFQQKHRKYAEAVRVQLGPEGLQPRSIPKGW